MNEELEQKLYDKYPKIFKDKDLSARESCMAWGIGTPDSWYDLLDDMCGRLQWYTDKNGYPQVVAEQVKEKFGTLRFYYRLEDTGETEEEMGINKWNRADGWTAGTISAYESMSSSICDTCGTNKNIECTKGWVRYVCKDCLNAEEAERRKLKQV